MSQFLNIPALNLQRSLSFCFFFSSKSGWWIFNHLPTPIPHDLLNATHATIVSRLLLNLSFLSISVLLEKPSTISFSSPVLWVSRASSRSRCRFSNMVVENWFGRFAMLSSWLWSMFQMCCGHLISFGNNLLRLHWILSDVRFLFDVWLQKAFQHRYLIGVWQVYSHIFGYRYVLWNPVFEHLCILREFIRTSM